MTTHTSKKPVHDLTSDNPGAQFKLTAREQEVLLWCAHAKSSWEIGQILQCKESTVNFHVSNILRKFDVTNRVAAVLKGLRHGMLQQL
ncbi:response regulator transcription factor [Pseudomonas auratipiscis]|uniref:Helix-turn-helix transcriptional regulator n=1 Tax=Pseudomonas auratipiscis TaxID=3115853 RepID=A0AB35WV92_9PSED|nr:MULTISPECIES: helix-turn-helix transcriptional regulator [unclassified Pseudomonas]MEE1868538.1 helix-turn-helix transcriptional regulator [Pseudomonas sp. 120P]MEE1959199.1 helix-turn-helix transcriptional regulator [Pseudomonas sp. 119P]